MFFAGAAEHLADTDYADACPIATIALEVSSTSEPMRIACADVFESWIAAGTPRFTDAGLPPDTARELMIAMICALEGAFVLARAARSTEPLRVAGELTAQAVERALEALVRDAPAAGARLGGGSARSLDPQHAHRLQAQRQLLAAVGG